MADNNLTVKKTGALGTASPLGDFAVPLQEPAGLNYTFTAGAIVTKLLGIWDLFTGKIVSRLGRS